MVSCNTIKGDIMKIYEVEKDKMINYLEKLESRVAIITNMWTSNQKKAYMAITVHYIDESWLLQYHIVRCVPTFEATFCATRGRMEYVALSQPLAQVVSKHHSRLHPDTLEALMCAQSWLWKEKEGSRVFLLEGFRGESSTLRSSSRLERAYKFLAMQTGYSAPAQYGIMNELGLSYSQYSNFGSILSIEAMIGAISSGWIADSIGRKWDGSRSTYLLYVMSTFQL
ncbi:Sugar transporter ERD6-like 8 [Vitis vinifera]|uniref:Sugar transporter ERD6-like 8 n=1 Tax=Vitis vinifera TaxID=29760 RepID=A0A438DKN9_VITVI|nr:Sugar transporter ERD6-like 8 [Vitis vinifera]